MATLVLKNGDAAGRKFTLAEGLNRLGRAPGNELQLEDPSISASHCELWVMKERLLVRDLGSTNGTYVNGRLVSEAELDENDILGVGNVGFEVREVPGRVAIPKPAPPPPPPPRYAPDGLPCCINHNLVHAHYRCARCGEQFCPDCVRFLGRRGGQRHAFCPLCDSECVTIVPPRIAAARQPSAAPGWLAKLTQTLRLKR